MAEAALTIRDEDYAAPVMLERPAPAASTSLVHYALDRGADLATIEKMMELEHKHEAYLAVKAFNAAMASAKAEIPVVVKNRVVDFPTDNGKSRTTYQHEDLGEIARTIDPILARHGLSYRFRTTSEVNQPVVVSCIVAHRDGHSETNTLAAGRDDSGKKNLIQQMGSTITYLQRYTLKAALGLAASADDDGRKSEPVEVITEDQVIILREMIEATNSDRARFLKHIKVDDLADIRADKFDFVLGLLKDKEQRRA